MMIFAACRTGCDDANDAVGKLFAGEEICNEFWCWREICNTKGGERAVNVLYASAIRSLTRRIGLQRRIQCALPLGNLLRCVSTHIRQSSSWNVRLGRKRSPVNSVGSRNGICDSSQISPGAMWRVIDGFASAEPCVKPYVVFSQSWLMP